MSDQEIRDLERQALAGDPGAAKRLNNLKFRSGLLKRKYVVIHETAFQQRRVKKFENKEQAMNLASMFFHMELSSADWVLRQEQSLDEMDDLHFRSYIEQATAEAGRVYDCYVVKEEYYEPNENQR